MSPHQQQRSRLFTSLTLKEKPVLSQAEVLWSLPNKARERLTHLVRVRNRFSKGQTLKLRLVQLNKSRLSLRRMLALIRSHLNNRIQSTSRVSEAKAEELSKGLRYRSLKRNSNSNQINKRLSLKFQMQYLKRTSKKLMELHLGKLKAVEQEIRN